MAFAKGAGFLHIHAFPYSKRAGTPAATMEGQVEESVKKERVHDLTAVAKQTANAILQEAVSQGNPLSVLFETCHTDGQLRHFRGHTPDFMEVEVTANCDLRGQTHTVLPTSVKDGVLLGEICTQPFTQT